MTAIHADLHCHSNASDGSDTPTRVVERAAERGLKALALTDHDTVAGVAEAQAAGERLGVEIIPGTELTCYMGKREIHVLGYGVRIDDAGLLEHCRRFQEARVSRAREIGRRLAEAGAPVDMDKVMAEADGGVVGRPHVARALVDAGHVADFQEAFDKFLADGKPAAVSKLTVDPHACIDIIRGAGGIAVMAHPALEKREDLIPVMLEAGCAGFEVWHSAQDATATDRLNKIALDRGTLRTGGSDCHGSIKGGEPILGQWGVDRHQYDLFRAALAGTAWGKAHPAAQRN